MDREGILVLNFVCGKKEKGREKAHNACVCV